MYYDMKTLALSYYFNDKPYVDALNVVLPIVYFLLNLIFIYQSFLDYLIKKNWNLLDEFKDVIKKQCLLFVVTIFLTIFSVEK